MSSRPLRLGLLGGTLDPVHAGHLAAATAARTALGLDVVHLVPAHVPAQKPEPGVSPWHRFAMAAIAVDDVPGLAVSDMELARAGPSYTVDTLRALTAMGHRATQVFFITGADAFARIDTWHEYPELLEAAHFVVVARPGHGLATHAAWPDAARARVRLVGPEPPDMDAIGDGTHVWLVEADTPDVSSSAMRASLRRHEDVSDSLPPRVAAHIRRHGLYGSTGTFTQDLA
jgi:nicotinate-nucleotide adenylyltransferase